VQIIAQEEPAMSSPIHFLLPSIGDLPFRIVPEHEAELRKVIRDLGITFVEEPKAAAFVFRAYPKSKKIGYSAYGVELLWAVAYVTWLFYEHREEGPVDTEDESTDIGQAVAMLRWGLTDRRQDLTGAWPSTFPTPSPSPAYASVVHVANELAAVAIAWILHHEINHIKLGHVVYIPSDLSKQNETEADRVATEYILPGARERVERSKRALGIVIATLTLVAIDLNRRSFASDTHPESYKRVIANLETVHLFDEHDAVRHVACVMLKLLMHIFEICTPARPYERPMDCLNDLAYTLSQLGW
jgi:hypothetical protein